MFTEEMASLACPSCKNDIFKPLEWFKQIYTTCPACGGGLAASQFATMIRDLEEAMDACTDEMINGASPCPCNCGGCAG